MCIKKQQLKPDVGSHEYLQFGRLRQEDYDFEASLSCIARTYMGKFS